MPRSHDCLIEGEKELKVGREEDVEVAWLDHVC